MSKKDGCPGSQIKIENRCIPRSPSAIFIHFLQKAKKEGHDNSALNKVVGFQNRFVATSAEIEAGRKFYKWVLEDIGKRYKLIGGKTWRAGKNMLFPAGIRTDRAALNMHMWDEYEKVTE